MRVSMTMEEYREHEEEHNGVCLECGAIRYGFTEGDAEGYPCEDCNADAVQGIMNALFSGNVVIE